MYDKSSRGAVSYLALASEFLRRQEQRAASVARSCPRIGTVARGVYFESFFPVI